MQLGKWQWKRTFDWASIHFSISFSEQRLQPPLPAPPPPTQAPIFFPSRTVKYCMPKYYTKKISDTTNKVRNRQRKGKKNKKKSSNHFYYFSSFLHSPKINSLICITAFCFLSCFLVVSFWLLISILASSGWFSSAKFAVSD